MNGMNHESSVSRQTLPQATQCQELLNSAQADLTGLEDIQIQLAFQRPVHYYIFYNQ